MKRSPILCVLVLLLAVQLACSIPTPTTTGVPSTGVTPTGETKVPPPVNTPLPTTTFTAPSATDTPAAGSITLEMLKNFTYTVEDQNTQVALKDGEFQGDHINSRFIEPAAFGDLNGDGRPDAAVVLATNFGGSGSFYDLIAVLDQNGAPAQAAFTSLGDRQVIKNLQITKGRILLDYLTQGLHDPFCCPSEHRFRSYQLEGSALHVVSEQVLTSPDAKATPLPNEITIDQPGPQVLNFLASPQPVYGRVSQVPPEKKLVYHVTDMEGKLITQGEIPLQGEPGGPGTFAFQFDLGAVTTGVYQVEVVDMTKGGLRGRSIVVLVPKSS